MGRDLGYFLIAVGTFFLLLKTDLWRPFFSNSLTLPILLIIFGVASVLIGLIPELRVFGTLMGWLFLLSIIFSFMANSYSFFSFNSMDFEEYYEINNSSGLVLNFQMADITVSRANDSYILVKGSSNLAPSVIITSAGVLDFDASIGHFEVVSLPDTVRKVSADLGIGQVLYSTGGENFTAKYSISIGGYSAPGRDSCSFCSGTSARGVGGREIDFNVGIGDVRIR